MWLEAILTKDDLAALVADSCPIGIPLGDGADADQYLKLFNPKDVSLVAERGLRVTCEAELRWPVLGIDVPVRAEALTVLLNLDLVPGDREEMLSFKPELEHLDLSWIPNLIDGAIQERIQQELARKQVEFSWRFFETLSHVLELPGALSPVDALDVRVAWGKVRITEDAVVLAVSFHARVLRSDRPPADVRTPLPLTTGANASAAPLANRAPAGVTVPVPLAVAGAAALAGVAAVVAFSATSTVWRSVFGRA